MYFCASSLRAMFSCRDVKYSWRGRNNGCLMDLNFAQNTYLETQTVPQTTENLLILKIKNNFGVLVG